MTETRLHDGFMDRDERVPYRAAEGLRVTAQSRGPRGPRNYVVRAPNGDMCQLGEEENFLLTMLDGRRSFGEIEHEFRAQFAEILSRQHFQSFVDELLSVGIILRTDGSAPPAEPREAAPIEIAEEVPSPKTPESEWPGDVVPAADEVPLYASGFSLAPLFLLLAALGAPLRHFVWLLVPAPVVVGIALYGQKPIMVAALTGLDGWIPALACLGAGLAALLVPNLVRGAAAAFHGAPREAFRLAGHVLPWFRIDRGWVATMSRKAQAWTCGAPLLARFAEFVIGASLWLWSSDKTSPLAVAWLLVGGVGLWSFLLTAAPFWRNDGRRWLAVYFGEPVFDGPLWRGLRIDRGERLERRGRGLLAAAAVISLTAIVGAALLWGDVTWHGLLLLPGIAWDVASPAFKSLNGVAAPWLGMAHEAISRWLATAFEGIAAAGLAPPLGGAIPREIGAGLLGGAYAAGLAWLGRAAAVADPLRLPARDWDGAPARGVPTARSDGGLAPIGRRAIDPLGPSLDERLFAGSQAWPSNTKVQIAAALIVLGLSIAFLSYPYESGGTFTILPNDQYDVRARVSGEIAEVLVSEGEQVKPGQLLATLADWKAVHDLAVAKAGLEKASAQLQDLLLQPKPEQVALARQQYEQAASRLPLSKADYERDLALVQTGAVSVRQFEQSRSAYEQDKAAIEVTKANYDLVRVGATQPEIEAARATVRLAAAQAAYAEDQLARTRIRATGGGTVVTPNPQLMKGKYLKEGDLFVQLQDRRVAHVEVQVPESDIREVSVGSRVRAKAWGYEHTMWRGKVILIAPDAQPVQALGNIVRVVAEIPNPDGLLRPQMSGYAKVQTAEMPVWESFTRAFVRFVLVELWSWVP